MLRFLIYLMLVLSSLAASLGWAWLQRAMDETLRIPESAYLLKVPKGGNLNQVAMALESEGVLSSVWPLKIFARLNEHGGIHAGEYAFQQGATVRDLLAKLESGAVNYYQITFPEGLALREWLALLQSRENIDKTTGLDIPGVGRALGISGDNPEGWFAPDTYSFNAGDSDLSVLKRAYVQMQDQLNSLWLSREQGLPYETAYEALIMASIIEKETGVESERAAIAGVFVRRLQKGMLLQTDPTVIYGLGEDYAGNLKREHLRSTSPYNTYRIKGLPPTPIASPGAAAIAAALHPAAGSALYFVARGDGSHYFSSSLAEHERAVREYQIKRRRKDYRSTPQ